MRTRKQRAPQMQRVQLETAPIVERDSRIYLLPRSAGPADRSRSSETCSIAAEAMVVVRVLGGPRDDERFATRLTGLVEGAGFRYFDEEYTFVRDSTTGRWGAIPSRPND